MCELKLNCRTGNKKDRRVLTKNKQMKLVLPCVEFVYSLVRLLSSHITFDFSLVLSWDNEAVVSRFFITTLFSPNVKIYIDRGYHGNQQSWFITRPRRHLIISVINQLPTCCVFFVPFATGQTSETHREVSFFVCISEEISQSLMFSTHHCASRCCVSNDT